MYESTDGRQWFDRFVARARRHTSPWKPENKRRRGRISNILHRIALRKSTTGYVC